MPDNLKTLAKRIDDLGKSIADAKVDQATCTNATRRVLFSDIELVRMDLQALGASMSEDDSQPLTTRLDDWSRQLKLRPVSKSNAIGKFFRLSSLALSVMIAGAFLALPIIMLRSVDAMLGTDSSEKLKRLIAHWLLLVSGVMVTIEGLEETTFEAACVLLTFSHASNLDGFMISASCPVHHYALAKKELFLVPFFSWISLAFGGVPVDRNDRTRAIRALQRSTEAASAAEGGGSGKKMCLAIAPEGTRSQTGQLNGFKKGAFHMWEQMQAPIVPVSSGCACV